MTPDFLPLVAFLQRPGASKRRVLVCVCVLAGPRRVQADAFALRGRPAVCFQAADHLPQQRHSRHCREYSRPPWFVPMLLRASLLPSLLAPPRCFEPNCPACVDVAVAAHCGCCPFDDYAGGNSWTKDAVPCRVFDLWMASCDADETVRPYGAASRVATWGDPGGSRRVRAAISRGEAGVEQRGHVPGWGGRRQGPAKLVAHARARRAAGACCGGQSAGRRHSQAAASSRGQLAGRPPPPPGVGRSRLAEASCGAGCGPAVPAREASPRLWGSKSAGSQWKSIGGSCRASQRGSLASSSYRALSISMLGSPPLPAPRLSATSVLCVETSARRRRRSVTCSSLLKKHSASQSDDPKPRSRLPKLHFRSHVAPPAHTARSACVSLAQAPSVPLSFALDTAPFFSQRRASCCTEQKALERLPLRPEPFLLRSAAVLAQPLDVVASGVFRLRLAAFGPDG